MRSDLRCSWHAELTESCQAIGGCEIGSALVTASDRLLADDHRGSLTLAEQAGVRSVAFPCILTGIYGFPAERAASIAVAEVVGHLGELQRVALVAFSDQHLAVLSAALDTHR
jgi:O-acetyl-ADP-ribose deacetylase (regulator of RNase III)